ncbi:MAG TPA: hypothetical protein VFA45_17600 [Actinomycetes bacterium]|nr:hypothetical protein [Actinomycetes bacterium]
MQALRSLTATLALAALSILPAGTAQAHTPNQDHNTQPVSRPTYQTPAQQTLGRVLAREHHTYPPAASDPAMQPAQRALARTLAREGHASPAPADGQQAASPQQAAPRGTFPLLPVLTAAGLTTLAAAAATWRRLRARSRPREAT